MTATYLGPIQRPPSGFPFWEVGASASYSGSGSGAIFRRECRMPAGMSGNGTAPPGNPVTYVAAGVTRDELLHFCQVAPAQLLPSFTGDATAQILNVCGWPALFFLIEAYGGTELTIPIDPERLARRIPTLPAGLCLKLCREFHTVRFPVPTFTRLITAFRRARAAELHAAGISVLGIARRLWLTDRQIRSWLNQPGARRHAKGASLCE